MPLSFIVAMTRQRVIGREGQLPWRLSADLQRFKALTMGHHIVMGRKTYESLGRALPGRTSVIITRQPQLETPYGGIVTGSVEEALGVCGEDDEPFLIGGGEIFRAALPRAQRLYVTWVEADVPGDTHFPPWDPSEWRLVQSDRHSADARNEYDTTFAIYDRT